MVKGGAGCLRGGGWCLPHRSEDHDLAPKFRVYPEAQQTPFGHMLAQVPFQAYKCGEQSPQLMWGPGRDMV